MAKNMKGKSKVISSSNTMKPAKTPPVKPSPQNPPGRKQKRQAPTVTVS